MTATTAAPYDGVTYSYTDDGTGRAVPCCCCTAPPVPVSVTNLGRALTSNHRLITRHTQLHARLVADVAALTPLRRLDAAQQRQLSDLLETIEASRR